MTVLEVASKEYKLFKLDVDIDLMFDDFLRVEVSRD